MKDSRAFLRSSTALLLVIAVATCTSDDQSGVADDGPVAPSRISFDVTPGIDPVVVAVGDMVCGTGTAAGLPCGHAATAAVTSTIAPNAVLLLGDIQYEAGSLSDFNTYFAPTWGVHKPITYPSPGNHEYQTTAARGYFDYFNGVGIQNGPAGDRTKGYYSYNIGAWHVISLNSNCTYIPCSAGSAQEQWLRADLAANQSVCTLAYWHHPRFSSGGHGNNSSVQALWQALYDFGADLVLGGHDHEYERFAPQTPTGAADATRGIREFVVGTGGKEYEGFATVRANSQVRNGSSLGVLKLTLRATGYDWRFVSIPGHTNADAGTSQCNTYTPPPPPTGTTTLTINANADAYTFKDQPSRNYGGSNPLLVDGSPTARTYMRFAVSGIGAKSIVSAKLRVYAVDPSDTGGRLHRVAGSWSETSINWNNQPAYTAATVGTIGTVVANAWYEIDVKSEIAGDGTVSFALESTSTNGADYRSREGGSSTAPRLVIVVQ